MGESSIMNRSIDDGSTGDGGAGPDAEIQQRIKGKGVLEQFLRHLESIDIDLSDSELTLESCLPGESQSLASVEHSLTRTFDLDDERHESLRDAVDNPYYYRFCHGAAFPCGFRRTRPQGVP